MEAKKLYVKTHGCQMNVYDSQRMIDILSPLGYSITENSQEADMVIINTCHIREKAENKLYSELGRYEIIKSKRNKSGKDTLIAVAGCVAQAEGEHIMSKAPFVDIVLGPQTIYKLGEAVATVTRKTGRFLDTEFPIEPKFDHLPDSTSNSNASAFLAVQEGCDKFCTFCVVPYTRGAEYSRPVADIIKEAKILVQKGAVELNLLGQNVNAYHGEDTNNTARSLAELIAIIADKVPEIKRIKYTTSHPRDMQEDLMKAHRDIPQLMPYLHLPLQSGSNKILQAMNRKHTVEEYKEIIAKARDFCPDIALSSDFIVGFPGETDQDFADTLKIVEEVNFSSAYSFNYSIRPGTPAGIMPQQVPEELKSQRLAILQARLLEQQKQAHVQHVGSVMPVLFERITKKSVPGNMEVLGKNQYNQNVHVKVENPDLYLGKIINVNIETATAHNLYGSI